MKRHSRLARTAMTLLAMLFSSVTAWATITGSGTNNDPYLISSADDWNTFAANVNGGTKYEGKYLQLGADITVSTMVGTNSHKFMGMFDGAGHTLTFNLGTSENQFSEDYAAPFRYVDGAYFRNLHVAGDIFTSARYVGGLLSDPSGYCFIKNCRVSVAIHSSYNGDGTDGGFVGLNNSSSGFLMFINCLFDGQMLQNGNTTHSCGGFVGWHNCPVEFNNCLFAPSDFTINYENTVTFARNGVPTTNACYYITSSSFNIYQGTNANSMSNDNLLAGLGSGWEIVNEKVVPAITTLWSQLLLVDNQIAEGTAGHYYVKMPKEGVASIILSEEDIVANNGAFKIYDDGGKNSAYSKNCSGSLFIIVPSGYKLHLTGSVEAEGSTYDYMTLYQGTNYSHVLGNDKYGSSSGENIDVTCLDRKMRVYFKSDGSGQKDGMNITVNIEAFPSTANNISISSVSGGGMTASPSSAAADETISLSATPNNNYLLSGIEVQDAAQNSIDVNWALYDNTATFTMPYSAVTVTPTFIAKPTVTLDNTQNGGTIATSVEAANPGSTVTLTATPDNGYVLSGISVKDANNNDVNVDWSTFSNTATFTLPMTDVTVTPTFTNDWANLSVNLPATGAKEISVPAVVQSFKLYDDGGANGDYSNYCDGYLTLTAPQGYKFLITGNVHSDTGYKRGDICDYLTIYDGGYNGSGNAPSYLGDEEKWGLRDDFHDIGGIHPTGQSVTFYFHSDNYFTYSGVNLTVELVDITTPVSITRNNASGGSISAPESAIPFSTVTVTATPNSGYAMNSIIVKDANNQTVDVDWSLYDNTATFMMPPTAVTITPTFTNDISNISFNMPTTGHQSVDVLLNTTSFKVYDDGGPSNDYSPSCSGYLTLVAPVGYRVQLKGTVESDEASNEVCDYLTVYDGVYNGKGDAPNYLGSKEKFGKELVDNIGTITSNGRRMTLYFYSTWSNEDAGLDLTVSLVEDTERDVVINQATGGTIVATPAKAVTEQVVTLTSTTNSEYTLTGLSVKDANNNDVHVNWNAFANTATFTMPTSAVTVTPTYTHSVTSEGLSVNMPVTGIKTVVIPENVRSFKVYDDGGATGKYTAGCGCHLILLAPENYIMKVTGTLTTAQYGTGFSIWNNPTQTGNLLIANAHSSTDGEPKNIGVLTSTGNGLYFDFSASISEDAYSGLDITVTLINTLADYNVVIEDVVGGSVVATPNHGKYGANISLSATPATGYVLNGITAEDANHYVVGVNGGEWYSNNTASFSMNGTDVTVSPTFTNDLTASTLFVNMPRNGGKSAVVPASVQSFKVYDHGGANGYYDAFCDGTLTLSAPSGCKLQVTGTMKTGSSYDKLSIYDGTTTSASPLLENMVCNIENLSLVTTNIGVINSSDRYMTIKFKADPASTYGEGLNLTVTVVDTNASHDINVASATNGSVVSDVLSAKFDETVTLTATPANGYALASLVVLDANNNEVPVTWNVFENTATFVMPATAVTVTSVFTSTNPLVINMPRRNTVRATIPAGVTTLKVYDDGGENGPFSAANDGTLVLTAPANCIMRVWGWMSARHNFDYFRIYNGDDTNTAAALSVTPEKDDVYENVGTFVSNGNVMTFHFAAEFNSAGRAGLNIKVDVIPVLDLADNTNNVALITENANRECNVTLGRTLQTGGWNTFCAPFNASIPSGWTVKKLSSSSLTGTALTLNFADASSIEAGKPYMVKVSSTEVKPVFNGVTVVNGTTATQTDEVDFVPVMNPTELTANDKSVLFVKGGNKLTYPTATANMNGFRAYFKLHDANSARSFMMNFGDGETTEIMSLTPAISDVDGAVYNLQGQRVNAYHKGLVIKNGRKFVNK